MAWCGQTWGVSQDTVSATPRNDKLAILSLGLSVPSNSTENLVQFFLQ